MNVAKTMPNAELLLERNVNDGDIRAAVEADIQQWFTDSLTPDRGYLTPIHNTKALLSALVVENETLRAHRRELDQTCEYLREELRKAKATA